MFIIFIGSCPSDSPSARGEKCVLLLPFTVVRYFSVAAEKVAVVLVLVLV